MKRRNFLKALFAAATLCTLTQWVTAVPEPKPNVIYIMLDEWGYFEWSAMGHPILETPNIDKLAWKRVIK